MRMRMQMVMSMRLEQQCPDCGQNIGDGEEHHDTDCPRFPAVVEAYAQRRAQVLARAADTSGKGE